MNPAPLLKTFFFCIALLFPGLAFAQDKNAQPPYAGAPGGLTSFLRGGGVYQTDTDLDGGGSYSSTRFTVQFGTGYSWDRQDNLSVSVGYSYDGYDFAGNVGLGSLNPWEDIHTVSLGIPMRKGIDRNWTAFAIPSIRSTGESGAGFSGTLTGGILGGASYRFSDRLSIGPGIGVFSQLEDSATVIPVLLIDWRLSDSWSLTTGRGLGATMGPGLTLNYRPVGRWSFGLGGRYEKLRFRLDKDGTGGGGIGEDVSFPVFLTGSFAFDARTNISLIGGCELGGELKLEDRDGRTIQEESYDAGIFLGLSFSTRL